MDDGSTYVDPNPMQPNSATQLHIGGRWMRPNVAVANVRIACYWEGSKFFDETYPCNGDDSCPTVESTFGGIWSANFQFVSGGTSSNEQEIHVQALDQNYNPMFELRSTFYIQ